MSKIESFNQTVLDGIDIHINMYKEQSMKYKREDFMLHVDNLFKIMKLRGVDPVVIQAAKNKVSQETGIQFSPPSPSSAPTYSLR